LITCAVQQDVLPGVSHDWLVRPIRRRDMACAKLLFVVVSVHGPMMLADVAHGMAIGFAIRDAVAAAVSRSIYILLVFDLPVLALAAMTRTVVQVAVGLLGIWFIVVAGVGAGILVRGGTPPVFAGSGIQWMTPAFWSVLAAAAALVIIPLQYGRRATTRARTITLMMVLLAPILSLSTWSSAFAVQQRLSRNPSAAQSIEIAFDPSIGGLPAEPGANLITSATPVQLPLRVSGLVSESTLVNDRADVRVIDRNGTTLFRGRSTLNLGYSDDLPVRTQKGGEVRTHQRIVFPPSAYQRLRAMQVRLEIDYSLTLFRLETENAIAPIDGALRSAAFGSCRTKMDDDGDEIEFGCVTTGAAPACVSVALDNPSTARRNPENIVCMPDYTPYRVHIFPDAMDQWNTAIKFRDRQGLARYPVEASQLADAHLIIKSYRPDAHFTRRLVITDIHLSDWAATGSAAGGQTH
jgi:hypothetical protein